MESLQQAIELFLHIDRHLVDLMNQYGSLTYVILFVIIFCETGLVVTPFLPGDSLLFAAGALTSMDNSPLDPWTMIGLLIIAAVIGDGVNYHIGKFIGPRAFSINSRFLKQEHLKKTHEFYEKYGGKTIIIARFVPIVRTFAPFIAGVGTMSYRKFLAYNVIGGVLWVTSFVLAGHWFGNQPLIKKNFTLVILAIIVISVLPAVYEYWKAKRVGTKTQTTPQDTMKVG